MINPDSDQTLAHLGRDCLESEISVGINPSDQVDSTVGSKSSQSETLPYDVQQDLRAVSVIQAHAPSLSAQGFLTVPSPLTTPAARSAPPHTLYREVWGFPQGPQMC